MSKITPKQKRFADEYLIDLKPIRAYRAVYTTVKKDETAAAAATRLLKNVNVSEYISKRMKDRERRTEITQDRVLMELASIGFSKGTDYAQITPNGSVIFVATDELTEQQKAAIVSIKETQNGTEIKLADKIKALELLGKHLGLFDNNGTGINTEQKIDQYLSALEGALKHEH